MTQSQSPSLLSVGLGLGAAAFVGYCVYFDKKRRSDPLFKQKLKERRQKARSAKSVQKSSGKGPAIPDLSSPEDAQAFFLQEVQLGEELLAQGEIEEGVDHLCTAVTLCGQPQGLLQILQQTLPPTAFALLVERLPGTQARLMEKMGGGRGVGGAPKRQGAQVTADDDDDDEEEKDDPNGPILQEIPAGQKKELIAEDLE